MNAARATRAEGRVVVCGDRGNLSLFAARLGQPGQLLEGFARAFSNP